MSLFLSPFPKFTNPVPHFPSSVSCALRKPLTDTPNSQNYSIERQDCVELNYSFLKSDVPCEATAVSQKINKRHSNYTIYIKNEVWFLRCCNLLNFQSIIQKRLGWKTLHYKFLNNLHTHIRIVNLKNYISKSDTIHMNTCDTQSSVEV